MPFDAEGYRKAAKAAGIPDDEIEKDIAEEMGNIKPVTTPPQKSDVQVGGEYDWMLPAAAVGAVGLGAAGIGLASKKIKDRMMSKPEQPRIEPTMDTSRYAGPGRIEPTFDVPTAPAMATEAPPMTAPKGAELAVAGAQNTAQNALNAEVERLKKAGQVPGSVQPVAPIEPAAIAPSATPPVTVTPPQPTVSQAVATNQDPTKSIQAEIAQQIDATPAGSQPPKNKGGRPSKAAREAELAQGVFKEGFGGADNWLQSQVGHDIRRFIKDEFNAGKPYGSGQAALDKAYSDVGKYEQWLKENIPVQTLNKAERKALGVPSPAPYGPLGKAIKVGGTAGLLMSAVNAANAREAVQNVGEALLPIGITPGTLETGTLTEKQLRAFQEAQKLGSPYRSVPPPR